MTKKSKKLGVKTNKTAVFDDESFEVNNTENADSSDPGLTSNEPDTVKKETPISKEERTAELNQICKTLDKLTLDMMLLMQRQMQQKLNIEKSMTDGELHLSKSRYIMGHKNVSTLQLPTESSEETDPSVTVEEVEDEKMLGKPRLQLKIDAFTKPPPNDDSDNGTTIKIQDPVNWFGVLVPRDLRSAQAKFRDALTWVVDCANTQIRLQQTCIKIKQLTQLKKELQETNEE